MCLVFLRRPEIISACCTEHNLLKKVSLREENEVKMFWEVADVSKYPAVGFPFFFAEITVVFLELLPFLLVTEIARLENTLARLSITCSLAFTNCTK